MAEKKKAKKYFLTTPAIKANCVAYISTLDNPNTLVIIKDAKQSRSDAQHSLKWGWMGYLEKHRAGVEGWSREKWNRYFKWLYIRPLLIEQDPDWNSEFQRYDSTYLALTAYEGPGGFEDQDKYFGELFWDRVKTENLNVANMSAWMDKIDRHCINQYGITLPVPDDLGWAR